MFSRRKEKYAGLKQRVLDDCSNWMSSLSIELQKKPINELTIPGSHDSGAYWLDPSTPICPDESDTIKNLCKWFGSCAKNIVVKWSITQDLTITEQLQAGIRYIDMRTGYLESENDFFFAHGVYGKKTIDLLCQVNSFVKYHPKEIVILDFNHFYSFTEDLHVRLVSMIYQIFGDNLLAPTSKGLSISLNEIWETKGQVIVAYWNNDMSKKFSRIWHGNIICSPWFNTSSTSVLLQDLNDRFNHLMANSFNVFQAILTPQNSTVALHLASSLKKVLGIKCNQCVSSWLDDVYESKRKGVNIVIIDFIETADCVAKIIKLNGLLLKDKKVIQSI